MGLLSQLLFHILYLSVNCTFGPSEWCTAVGNQRFFDPQVATLCGDKRRPFLGEGETKIFLNFLIVVVFLLLTVCFNILGYWLRWFFKCSRLPTPDLLLKHIIIGAQGLGSDPWASLKMAGWGDVYAAYPTSPPGCIITKDGLTFMRDVLN